MSSLPASITLLAAGTLGDAEASLALATGLARAGHRVRFATHELFRSAVERRGFEFSLLPGDPRAMLNRPEAIRRPGLGCRNRLMQMLAVRRVVDSLLTGIGEEDYRRACAGSDLLIFTPATSPARAVAEELGVPSGMADWWPTQRTSAFPHPGLVAGLSLGPLGNLLSYPLAERVLGQPFREPLKPKSRRAVGLSPRFGSASQADWPGFPVLLGFSPNLVPRPDDWPARLIVTGAWLPTSPAGATLSQEVEDFLTAGPAPVYVGFGSMRPPDPRRFTAAVLEGIRLAGRRAILGGGWGALREAGRRKDVLVVDEVPFDLLFPRVSAVVHHGGAGTVHLGLRAGRPTLVVPFVFDQFFWGARVAALGVGPDPLPSRRLTPERFAAALRALAAPEIGRQAAALGARMSREDGPARAADAVNRVLSEPDA